MRLTLLASLLVATASLASAAPPSPAVAPAPAAKPQLLVPPANARHYTINSSAGKHGDNWSWTLPDGRTAYRMSMNLRGWIAETDAVMTIGKDKRPTALAIRGYADEGDATEDFHVDGDVSQDLRALRRVDTVFLDGYRLKGAALRQANGLSRMPK